jgi:hypothetical protein
MYEAKTKQTTSSVAAYLGKIEDDERRKDCKALAALMKRVTGSVPRMWGTSIVGFESFHYKYASGHEGDTCVVGFSSRKGEISVYLLSGFGGAEAKKLLSELGRHKTGKGCLYIRRLADVQLPVLERLVAHSVADTRRRYKKTQSQSS